MTKKWKYLGKVAGGNWPSDEELEEVIKDFSNPDYPYVSYSLPENPTSEQRIKYGLCEAILRYEHENKLSLDDITKMLSVDREKAIDVLYTKIHKLSLEELMIYVDKLHIPFKILTSSGAE